MPLAMACIISPTTNEVETLKHVAPNIKNSLALIGAIAMGYFLIPAEYTKYLSLIPRNSNGWIGIFTIPLVHVDFQHLIGNLIPITVMLGLLSGLSKKPITIVLSISLIGGVLLWLFGRTGTSHLGASVILFGLATYLIIKGFKTRKTIDIIAGVLIIGLYGLTMIQGIIPTHHGVSWDGHLCGMVAGGMVALNMRDDPDG